MKWIPYVLLLVMLIAPSTAEATNITLTGKVGANQNITLVAKSSTGFTVNGRLNVAGVLNERIVISRFIPTILFVGTPNASLFVRLDTGIATLTVRSGGSSLTLTGTVRVIIRPR